jgi:hypothetical protein
VTKTILRRHLAAEAVLLDATVHTAPVVKPRGVAPAPLRGRPGIAADVLRELRAEGQPSPADRAALAKLAGPMHGIPTRWLRPVPLAAVVVDELETVAVDIAATVAADPWKLPIVRVDLGIALTDALTAHADHNHAADLIAAAVATTDALNTLGATIRAGVEL